MHCLPGIVSEIICQLTLVKDEYMVLILHPFHKYFSNFESLIKLKW